MYTVHTPPGKPWQMKTVWDPKKAEENYRKHGIRFADAATIFDDDFCLTIEDHDNDEQRWITVGADSTGRVLVVAWGSPDSDTIRVISARKASPGERRDYEDSRL